MAGTPSEWIRVSCPSYCVCYFRDRGDENGHYIEKDKAHFKIVVPMALPLERLFINITKLEHKQETINYYSSNHDPQKLKAIKNSLIDVNPQILSCLWAESFANCNRAYKIHLGTGRNELDGRCDPSRRYGFIIPLLKAVPPEFWAKIRHAIKTSPLANKYQYEI